MFRGKKYQGSVKLFEKSKLYDPAEALELAIKTSKAKFDETVELHIKLGVDSRHADQQVRGATTSIQVQPLHGGAAYNVVPPSISSSTDPAHLEGQAQWKVFTFK